MVAELHFHGASTAGQGQQLVAKADAEGRHARFQDFNNRGDGVIARCRVAGAIGEEHAVRAHRQHLYSGCLRRHHGDAAAAVGEQAQDVGLDTEVVGDDVIAAARGRKAATVEIERTFLPFVDVIGADNLGEIEVLQARKLAGRFDGGVNVDVTGHQRTALCTALAQQARQFSRIDSRNRQHTALCQPFRQGLARTPIARAARHVANNQASTPDLRGLVILRCTAGVADVRIGQGDHLPCVGGVGQDFLIAGECGVEHHLADGKAERTDGITLEYGSVFERKDGGLGHGDRPCR